MTIVDNVVEEKLTGVYTLLENLLKETMNIHDETRTIVNLIKIRLQDHNESRKAVLHHHESLQREGYFRQICAFKYYSRRVNLLFFSLILNIKVRRLEGCRKS